MAFYYDYVYYVAAIIFFVVVTSWIRGYCHRRRLIAARQARTAQPATITVVSNTTANQAQNRSRNHSAQAQAQTQNNNFSNMALPAAGTSTGIVYGLPDSEFNHNYGFDANDFGEAPPSYVDATGNATNKK